MTTKFFVTVSSIHVDHANQFFDSYLSTIGSVDSLDKAFEKALTFHQSGQYDQPESGSVEHCIQIHEKSSLIAMASVTDGALNWLKSPTVADAIEWRRSVLSNLEKIENEGLNADCGQNEQSFAFQVCASLIAKAQEKLSTLFQPRKNDEVYDTLKKVEERLLNRSRDYSPNIFEMSR